jgi:hypothetical protein
VEVIMAKKKVATSSPTGMATATKKKAATKKKPSGYFAGMEPVTIEALEEAAERYEDAKVKRMQLTEREVELKEELQLLMEHHAKARTPGMGKTDEGHPRYHAQSIHRIIELEQAGGLVVKVKKEPKPPKAEE